MRWFQKLAVCFAFGLVITLLMGTTHLHFRDPTGILALLTFPGFIVGILLSRNVHQPHIGAAFVTTTLVLAAIALVVVICVEKCLRRARAKSRTNASLPRGGSSGPRADRAE